MALVIRACSIITTRHRKKPTRQIVKRVPKIISPWEAILLFTIVFSCLTTPTYGVDITLEWDPNTEPNLKVYKVYYKTGSPGPPYTGLGAWEGKSPIAIDAVNVPVGSLCRFTFTGLGDNQPYYFVVTAYNTEGFESDYSNEVGFNYDSDGPYEYPTMYDIWPCKAEPGTIVMVSGSRFGDTQQDSVVHIGPEYFGTGHQKIKFWSDTIMWIRIPFTKKSCDWFKHGDGEYRKHKLWMTVDGTDSNKKTLKVLKPASCP